MKLLRTFVLSMLVSVWTLSATAQQQHHEQQTQVDQSGQQGMMKMMRTGMDPSMMQSEAMGNMHETQMQFMTQTMNDPFKHSAMLIRVLPTMGDVLALSDEQVTSSEKVSQNYQEKFTAIDGEVKSTDKKIENLLANSEPDPKTVKDLLRKSATGRADLQALAFETAIRTKAILTDEQRKNLAEMSPMQMNHQIMMRMTMMDMMQMMGDREMPCDMMEAMQDSGMKNNGIKNIGMKHDAMKDQGNHKPASKR